METRWLGALGPQVSVVGLGGNNFGARLDERQTRAVVHAALDAGVTHFDTAETYGGGLSEVFLGKALGPRRKDVIVASKFARRPAGEPYAPGALRRRIYEGCDVSLRRLGTDYIDIYYQHHPDPEAPIEEAQEALGELITAGKIHFAACSNYDAGQIEEAAEVSRTLGRTPFVACQIHWNLLFREVEADLVPALLRHGIGMVPYFPLESGLLTGKYRMGQGLPQGSRLATNDRYRGLATADALAYVERLRGFALERRHTLLELAFAWLASQEGVASVIAGAMTTEQVRANVAAGNSWRLTGTDLEDIPRRG
ncbi:MAG: aldo/keto reductase [Actinobacteria bacterium]|nr:aldo/keto reductase [Actinomycetota bacterium]